MIFNDIRDTILQRWDDKKIISYSYHDRHNLRILICRRLFSIRFHPLVGTFRNVITIEIYDKCIILHYRSWA